MTVAELIAKLHEFNPEMPVSVVGSPQLRYGEPDEVFATDVKQSSIVTDQRFIDGKHEMTLLHTVCISGW